MERKLSYLLISLVSLLVLFPFLEVAGKRTLLNIIFSAILFTGVYAISDKKEQWVYASMFGIPWILTSWLNDFSGNYSLELLSHFTGVLFMMFTIGVLATYLMKARRVSKEVLIGALCIYLLLGIAWGAIYSLMDFMQPGSFYTEPEYDFDGHLGWSDFIYFSFVTLTTLGYGDITPVSLFARSFVVLETIIGVFYVAILIARLVAMYKR